jgi:hypothetical protein
VRRHWVGEAIGLIRLQVVALLTGIVPALVGIAQLMFGFQLAVSWWVWLYVGTPALIVALLLALREAILRRPAVDLVPRQATFALSANGT